MFSQIIKSVIGLSFFIVASGLEVYAQKDKYLVEAEKFQFKGKWAVERERDCMGSAMLRLSGGGSADEQFDALTVIQIMEEGDYHVWVRSADYEKSPGTRLFRLSVNGQPMKESGKHGKVGFYWEKVGNVHLERKKVLLRLHDTKKTLADVMPFYW